MSGKVMSLHDAVAKYVEDGDVLVMGGFPANKMPMAAAREIIRQGKKDFIGYSGPGASDWDMLIGENRLKAYINCYTADAGVTAISRRFREKIEKGELYVEDYSQDVMILMFHAASLGMPTFSTRLMMGSGLTSEWGISKEVRKTIDKLPDDKFVYKENPFKKGETLLEIPVPEIDTAIIHVQKASPDGTCIILGSEFHDVDIAIAARKTIVTCEELISDEEIRRNPEITSIPHFCVDAVCHVPYGAYPQQCYGYYDTDTEWLKQYGEASRTDETFHAFMKEWVYDLRDHREFLEKIGVNRLLDLKVTQGYGYHKDLGEEN